VFALLHAANFSRIVDRHGDAPDLVDPQVTTAGANQMQIELNDPLDSNEITLQFMAMIAYVCVCARLRA
jgi:hypothetical protein